MYICYVNLTFFFDVDCRCNLSFTVHLIVLQGCICTADDKYCTHYCTAGLYLYCRWQVLYTLLYCRAVSVLQMTSTLHLILLQGCICTADDKYFTTYCTAGLYLYCRWQVRYTLLYCRAVSVLQMTSTVTSLGCGSQKFKSNTLKGESGHYG